MNYDTISIPKLFLGTIFLVILSSFFLIGCGTTTGERIASGAVIGGATGAAVGSFSANAGQGALIGAGIGALGGAIYDEEQKKNYRYNYPHQTRRNYRYNSYPDYPEYDNSGITTLPRYRY